MDLAAPDLKNNLVRLEPFSEDHRELLRATDAIEFMWRSLPAIQRGAGFDVYYNYMLKTAETGETQPFSIFEPDGERFFGVTAFLRPNRMHRRIDIGYTWLDEMHRGRGIYQAVQHLMIQRAIDWGARRIGWMVESRNERAVKAVIGLGAKHEGELRNYARFADGTWVNMAVLSMMRDEAKLAVHRLAETLEPSQA